MAMTVSKSRLKAHMLRIFREIEQSGEELIVTDHGKPVLTVTPLRSGQPVNAVFAAFQGQVSYPADINTPTGDE
jgi:antitoxin (DNA-binding transcriptional repressor) of toxin-antitoxin stability system